MRTQGMRLLAALGVLLGVALPTPAGGQRLGRPAVEAYYTRVGFGAGQPAGSTVRASGLGGRVMWGLAAPAGRAPWLVRHGAIGLFGAYTPREDVGFSAGQLGVAADVAPFDRPLAGRIEPFVSVGVGALRTRTLGAGPIVRPAARPSGGAPVGSESIGSASVGARPFGAGPPLAVAASTGGPATHLLLVPGVGARVQLGPALAVQGDVRSLLTVRGGERRRHRAIGTGVRLAF